MSLLIRNGRVVDPAGGTDAVADVLITDGQLDPEARKLLADTVRELIVVRQGLQAQSA